MKTVFVVDDSDTCLTKVEEVLENQYYVITLPSAAKMFAMLEKITPDLILLDISMPEMDGHAALRLLKKNEKTANIPVIFLTGCPDSVMEARSFNSGVVDFIIKPFSSLVLLTRIKMHLDMDGLIRERTEHLEQRTRQMESLYDNIISILADIVESRDKLTGGHIERTTFQTKILIRAMQEQKLYMNEIGEWDPDSVASSARLHDIGKISIPDSILNKPDRLSEEEFEIMKGHVKAGEKIVDKIIIRTKEDNFWKNAKIFINYHHERWDGTGYPHGLKGPEIPLLGRILALVDVYDALISERVYKKAFDHEKAVEIIKSESGKQFDPKIVEVFCKAQEQFMDVEIEW